jgi:hypothetical protein
MNLKFNASLFSSSNNYELEPVEITLKLPKHCPFCNTSVSNEPIKTIVYYEKYLQNQAYSIHYCPSCNDIFFSLAFIDENSSYPYSYYCACTFPRIQTNNQFANSIAAKFPNFIRIYNQSLKAENDSLNDIAGMGFRKALEFLIKDYAILRNPEKEDEISKMSLSSCINTYIDNPKLVTLSKASSWLGNDQVHYFKKHDDYDTVHLKSYIEAIAYYISCELSIDDASSLISK